MKRKLVILIADFIKGAEVSALVTTTISLFGVILPVIPTESRNAFFRFEKVTDLYLYIAGMIFLLIASVIIAKFVGYSLILLARNIKINVEVEEYLQPESYSQQYISLKIINLEEDDLTECVATLAGITQFYSWESANDILEKINPNHLPLSWGGGSRDAHVTVPGDKEPRVLNIAISSGNAGKFEFLFNGMQSPVESENARYRVAINIKGKLNGVPFKTITYRGCFRSRNYDQPGLMTEFFPCDENKGLIEQIMKQMG